MLRQTMIVVLDNHGDVFNEHNRLTYSYLPYEEHTVLNIIPSPTSAAAPSARASSSATTSNYISIPSIRPATTTSYSPKWQRFLPGHPVHRMSHFDRETAENFVANINKSAKNARSTEIDQEKMNHLDDPRNI